MDEAIQDYISRVNNMESLRSSVEQRLGLDEERRGQIIGALENIGLPTGLEAIQSLKDSNLIEKGKNLLSQAFEGDNSDLINNLKDGANKILSNLPDLGGDMSIGGDFLKNVSQLAGRPLGQGQQILQDIAKNTVQIPEGEGGSFLSKIGGILKTQTLDRLPLKNAVQQAQKFGSKVQAKLQDGELSTPEQRQASLTALSKDDLMARLPAGRNFQNEIEGLSGEARNQYIRVLQGDPTEMGDLLPEHLFDHAQFMSGQLKESGMLNPEELLPEFKQTISKVFDGLPRIVPRGGVARFTASGEPLQQPASTSDRLAGLLKSSIEKVQGKTRPPPAQPAQEPAQPAQEPVPQETRPPPAQPAPQEQEITPAEPEPKTNEEVQQGTETNEITPVQEGEQPKETGLNADKTTQDLVGEDIAKTAGEDVGKTVGEDVGESLAESSFSDLLGPVGGIVSIATIIGSLVEGLKKQQMPDLPIAQLQAGTD